MIYLPADSHSSVDVYQYSIFDSFVDSCFVGCCCWLFAGSIIISIIIIIIIIEWRFKSAILLRYKTSIRYWTDTNNNAFDTITVNSYTPLQLRRTRRYRVANRPIWQLHHKSKDLHADYFVIIQSSTVRFSQEIQRGGYNAFTCSPFIVGLGYPCPSYFADFQHRYSCILLILYRHQKTACMW